MAMLPFCGYHMADYFEHWLSMRRGLSETPGVFHVNWFRKDESGQFLWPGYSENMRVLQWIFDRVSTGAPARETPIGWMPRYEDLEWQGLSYPKERFEALQDVNPAAWRAELLGHEDLFLSLQPRLPRELLLERELLVRRL